MSGQCPTEGCEFPAHSIREHPHGKLPEKAGDPCRFCGEPVPDPPPCGACWTPIPANLADAKALLALGDLSVDPR